MSKYLDWYHIMLIHGIRELLRLRVYSTLCLMTVWNTNFTLVEVPLVIDRGGLNQIFNYDARPMPVLLVVNLSSHSFVGFMFLRTWSLWRAWWLYWKRNREWQVEPRPRLWLEDAGTYVLICAWQPGRSGVMYMGITPACGYWFWCWSRHARLGLQREPILQSHYSRLMEMNTKCPVMLKLRGYEGRVWGCCRW